MKILHCSDAHADWRTSGVDRFDEVEDAFAQTVRVALEEAVQLYLFTGDLTDPDDGPRALRALSLAMGVAYELGRHGIESVWIPGNHDVIEDGSGRTTLSPLKKLGGTGKVHVYDRPGMFTLDEGRHMACLPYPAATAPYDPAEWLREAAVLYRDAERSGIAVVAGHLQVEGATPGDETTEMGRGRDVFFPFEQCDPSWLLLNGHYHQGQTFERAGRKLHVPGSLVRLNHGEERNRPRFLIWEVP
jgi:DNA repair exonuclease SbcCD nuclease subunit